MRYFIDKEVSVAEISKNLKLPIIGNTEQEIKKIGSLTSNGKGTLKFASKKGLPFIDGIVVGFESQEADTLLVSENPRLDFCRVLNYLINADLLVEENLKSTISESATVASSAVIENNVIVGDNSIIEANVVIHSGSIIGSDCIIRAGSVIGSQGFGFEQKEDSTWLRFPHLGRVIVHDNVEIGALNSVCIGALDNTVIYSGVKTDNLVHIAHNCKVGSNSILTACTELSGGVTLGRSVWMGPNSSVLQKINIGDHAMVGIGSVVTKDVAAFHTVAGVPAKIIKRGS